MILDSIVKLTISGLRDAAILSSVDTIVNDWVATCNVEIPENSVEILCESIFSAILRSRTGFYLPTDAQVRAALDVKNKYYESHNSSPLNDKKLNLLDLSTLPQKLVHNEFDEKLSDIRAEYEFVLKFGLPMQRNEQYRYSGVIAKDWHSTKRDAIIAAMKDVFFMENSL